ncbi:putative membrane protein [Oopsacas minuta]|uniref:Membrane protein n=1 Tax=Oopsacas minuta TaxID=111878 RepID=A0AAV7JDX8_9METZ|nr:putative membrane protein [Oopsacas minuta]
MDEDEDGQPRTRGRPRGISLSSFVMNRYFQGDSLTFEPPAEMKQAFYNAAAIFFFLLLCVMGLYVAGIFTAFIRPLLWAVLCGTFLFPFKKTSNEFMRAKLSHCLSVGIPITLYLSLLPFWLLNDTGDLIVRVFQSHWVMFLLSGMCMPLLGWLSFATANLVGNILIFVVDTSHYILETADLYQSMLIWFIIIYFLTSTCLPFVYKSEVLSVALSTLLLPVWMLVATLVLVYIQILQLPLFLFIQTILVSAALMIQIEKRKGITNSDHDTSISTYKSDLSTVSIGETMEHVLSPVHPVSEGRHLEPEPELSRSDVSESSIPRDISYISASTTHSSPEKRPKESESSEVFTSEKQSKPKGWSEIGKFIQSQRDANILIPKISRQNIHRDKIAIKSAENRASRDRIFFLLFWACFLYKLYNNYWFLSLLLLPLPWIGLKKLLSTNTSKHLFSKITSLSDRVPKLCPDALIHAYYLFLKLDDKVYLWLEYSLDKLVTIFIMFMVCVVTCLFTAFTIMQFRQESFQIMMMGSHAWNRTAEYSMNTINQIMNSTVYEDQNVSSLINDKLSDWSGQIYFSSRRWLASEIRELISDDDEEINDETRIKMEQQLVDTLDQMFAAFRALQNSSNTFALSPLTANASLYDVAMSIVSASFNSNSMGNIVKLVKSNLSVILNLFRSVGELLVTNFGVLFLMSGKLFSLLLGGGSALLNFFFSSIIFFTSLFYLMLYSKNNYIPMRRILEFIPITNVNGLNPAKEIEKALSEAIVSVFDASLRMALFYGVYTWLIHSVFGVSIAFIPAAFAAVAGVVPFVGSYWACLAGVLELWFTHDQSLLAFTFFCLHLLPSYVVDQAIYAEVKGGAHPYLTGLAVAGGVYFNGIEGAIIGPIILCCLLAGANMYTLFIGKNKDDETEESNPF